MNIQNPAENFLPRFLGIVLVVSLTACGTMDKEEPPELVSDAAILISDEPSVRSAAMSDDGEIRTTVIEDVAGLESAAVGSSQAAAAVIEGMILYFDYDSARIDEVSAENTRILSRTLMDTPGLRIRLEGHTDERGTRAYNLALGERRAQNVRHIMLEQGVLPEQIDLVSYGEEVPAAVGQGDSFWQKNRRVEVIIEE